MRFRLTQRSAALIACLSFGLPLSCKEPKSGDDQLGTESSPSATDDVASITDAATPAAPDDSGSAGAGGQSGSAGTAGVGGQSGTVGTAGTAGTDGGIGETPEACSPDGAQRCTAPGSPGRERCESGAWVAAEACPDGEVCTGEQSECIALADICRGSADQSVCSGALLHHCGPDGSSTSQEACESEQHCQQGAAGGSCAVCLQGDFRCTGAVLEACAADGRAWEEADVCATEALCNPGAGACTTAACTADRRVCDGDMLRRCNADQTAFEDEEPCQPGLCDANGRQCDVCVAGARSCVGDSVRTCNAQGQGYDTAPCPSRCAGNGVCVDCITPADCPQADNECEVAQCNALGQCSVADAPWGETCSTGRCNGLGDCRCTTHAQCGSNMVCISGGCVAARCGDGIVSGSEQCDDGNTSNTDGCAQCRTAYCGDGYIRSGVEACEPGVGGWTTQTCSGTTCQRTAYVPCDDNNDCLFTETCVYGVCASTCLGSTSGDPQGMCKTIPTHTRSCYLDYCFVRCSANGSCPSGLICQTNEDIPLFPDHCLGEAL